MEQIIKTYFENKSEKSQRLGVPRITLYSWLKYPDRANLDVIENDVRQLLDLIEKEREKDGGT